MAETREKCQSMFIRSTGMSFTLRLVELPFMTVHIVLSLEGSKMYIWCQLLRVCRPHHLARDTNPTISTN